MLQKPTNGYNDVEPKTSSTPHQDAVIEEWIQSNVRGLSVHAPSLRQMVVFEEARLLDSSKKSN